jgi:SAM-dependent methyltransferase
MTYGPGLTAVRNQRKTHGMPTQDELIAQQRQLWGAAASGWERQADWFDRNIGETAAWLCEAARIHPGQHVLDVACGSGQPTATIAERVRPGGRVTATDLSPEMVAVTRRKAERLGLDNVEAREMDAQALAFADHSFDAATCRFGLMFCPDPVRAASEIRRVLRPGARFALTAWDLPAKNPFFTVLAGVVAEFMPVPPPDPTAPGPFRLAAPGELERVLREAGFHDISVESRPATLTYPSVEAYWQIQTDIASSLRTALAKLDIEQVAALKARALQVAASLVEGNVVRVTATPLCAVATTRA